MAQQPLISVIIPIYNAGEFLRPCLDSLLRQTFTEYEAILVNDGSTDKSLDVMREYAAKDDRFKVLDFPNGGYGKAMNRGMDAARGLYMAILEPDDMLPRKAYEVLWKEVENNARPDIVRGTYLTMQNSPDGVRYEWVNLNKLVRRIFVPSDDYSVFQPSTWSALYRLDFLREKGILHHESPGASYQDMGWFTQTIFRAEKWCCTDEIVYLYRMDNQGSSVKQFDKKFGALLHEYEFIYNKLNETPGLWERVKLVTFMRFIGNALAVYEVLSESVIPEFVIAVKETVNKIFSDVADQVPARRRKKWDWMMNKENRYAVKPSTPFLGISYRPFLGIFRYKIERIGVMHELEPGINYPVGIREVRSFCGIPFGVRHK
ncbi:MAG: glycosyltransferase [Akkermansia sp.]|nr:glycosyltransferase [Akkermansia sp.]